MAKGGGMLNSTEKENFLTLFNRDGYVLDFTNATFDSFTKEAVGTPLVEHYGLSKGKSLRKFVEEHKNGAAEKLLFALLEHYELNYQAEYDEAYAKSFRPQMKACYDTCVKLREREKASEPHAPSPAQASVEYLQGAFFDSDYMNEQLGLLLEMRESHPTDAIGKSKELVEACCKTILAQQNVNVEKNTKMPQLVKETTKVLQISADEVDATTELEQITKQILGSLSGLASGIVQFRNACGDGHGREASFQEAPVRYAKLAVGCSATLVEYLWETYQWRIEQGVLQKPKE